MLNSSVERVPRSTAPEINGRIRRQALASLARYRHAPREAVEARLAELKQEWDIERAIEANAASIALIGVILGAFVSPWFLILPAAVCAFLLVNVLVQAALYRWPLDDVLGAVALRRGRSKAIRIGAFAGAVLAAAYIVAVALTKNPIPL